MEARKDKKRPRKARKMGLREAASLRIILGKSVIII